MADRYEYEPRKKIEPVNDRSTARPADRGLTEMENVLQRSPMETYKAWRLSEDSKSAAAARFPLDEKRWNNATDDWRHFHWNYTMAQSIGKEAAKAYADSHEVDEGQSSEERDMDVRNNRLGRAMAVDPRFQGLSAEQAADLALRNQWLHVLKR